MTEIFGAVAGALSIAALFNNCVQCFEYLQLGRQFGRDFEHYQLKLDIAKLRLTRWGESVKVNEDPRFANPATSDRDARQVQAILENLETLFQTVHRSSKRYSIDAEQRELVTFETNQMQPVFRRLHNRLDSLTRQRQKQTSYFKKAAWALYDCKSFDKMIRQISGFVEDLEKILPQERIRHRLAELEIEDIDHEASLMTLKAAAVSTDNLLLSILEQRIEKVTARNCVNHLNGEDGARVLVGNAWNGSALTFNSGALDQTHNTVHSVSAKGHSAMQIGNTYGGKGIFD
ncbi:hypothetical protein N7541_002914 [Penicillium brevicompactum]|uniref:Prion-inhibition and propagation HeLo domain-containing protein n=1 Tax=Penicillium brevicompactum TaxID=5074 RepID=A0A9W9RM55_PENBR|nr:hypothetical protein N7541_002914 [Penicillium brevicompactum]